MGTKIVEAAVVKNRDDLQLEIRPRFRPATVPSEGRGRARWRHLYLLRRGCDEGEIARKTEDNRQINQERNSSKIGGGL